MLSVMLNVKDTLKTVDDRTVFFLSRACDDEVVVYRHIRVGQKLLPPYVQVTQVKLTSPTLHKEVAKVLVDKFFGVGAVTQKSRSTYITSLNALPDRQLIFKLKKSGAVVAHCVINNKECLLTSIHLDLSFKGIPSMKSVTVFGHDLVNKQPCEEIIPVTTDMMSKFDVIGIMKEVMSRN
jgi:hypothetical protein